MTQRPTYVADAALVSGYPAAVVAVALRDLARRGYFDRLRPDDRAELLAVIAAVERAGRAWRDRHAGSPEAERAETGASYGEQVTAEEAAGMLQITPRRVRQLAPSLGGCKTASGWTFDRDAVLAERARRASA